VIVGYGVSNDGIALNSMYVVPGPIFVLSADFTVGATDGDVKWQVEVGFGSTADALATSNTEAASASWPAFS
jgi:hypothetical protein